MVDRQSHSLWAYFALLYAIASPVSGISISLSSEGGGGGANSVESLRLDDSTYFHEYITLDQGRIGQNYQVVGSGKNSLMHSVSGNSFAIRSDIDSLGTLSASSYSFATGQAASKVQGVSGTGIMSLRLQGELEGKDASQEAKVVDGVMASSQSISVGEGQGALARQSTQISGEAGRVSSQAYTSDSLMLAEGIFSGRSSLDADLSAGAEGASKVGGNIAVNGATWLDDVTLQTISEENLGMSLQGLQATSDERIGSFSVRAVNMDAFALAQAAQSSDEATSLSSLSGGSSTSYILAKNSAGYPYRWNEAAPKVQLYLKSDTVPSNLDPVEVKYAISAAANTWDNAVAKNLFADGQPVISDPSKGIDQRDGFNVNAWKYLTDAPNALAYSRTWSGGPIVGGYYSALESDISYNSRWTWSTSGGDYDVQSVAVHELGHTIGLGDIYSTAYGGSLPPTDPRTQDFEQVMNAYDAPQRMLGNGDRTGARLLYGVPSYTDRLGNYKGNGIWALDYSGNGAWDGIGADKVFVFGSPTDQAVVGDWNGDGRSELANYKGNGIWALDYSGNGAWDGTSTDSIFSFGSPTDQPIVGDWNGDGKSELANYKGNGIWALDYNGNGLWDGTDADRVFVFGSPTDQPIVGDWNGDGRSELGNYKGNGVWALDYNGNGQWDGTSIDRVFVFGGSTDLPVVGDWNRDGKDELGNYKGNGIWALDFNGNGVWDGTSTDNVFVFGGSTDKPVVGKW